MVCLFSARIVKVHSHFRELRALVVWHNFWDSVSLGGCNHKNQVVRLAFSDQFVFKLLNFFIRYNLLAAWHVENTQLVASLLIIWLTKEQVILRKGTESVPLFFLA